MQPAVKQIACTAANSHWHHQAEMQRPCDGCGSHVPCTFLAIFGICWRHACPVSGDALGEKFRAQAVEIARVVSRKQEVFGALRSLRTKFCFCGNPGAYLASRAQQSAPVRTYRGSQAAVVAVEDFDRVREQAGDGVERLDCAFWAAGQIDDDGGGANGGDGSRHDRARRFLDAFGAHLFGKTRFPDTIANGIEGFYLQAPSPIPARLI